jgi:hypothetical protein
MFIGCGIRGWWVNTLTRFGGKGKIFNPAYGDFFRIIYFLPHKSKYFPDHPVLKNPEHILFLWWVIRTEQEIKIRQIKRSKIS